MCKTEYCPQTGTRYHYECEEAERFGTINYCIKDYFEGLVDMMYGKETYDRNEFERRIENICGYLQIKMPDEPLILIENGLRKV